MKKNIFTDNKSDKNSKGFYAALGISAVMIGSACFFAYSQDSGSEKPDFTAENSFSASDAEVDKKYTDIPKLTTTTTAAVTTTSALRTTVVTPVTAASVFETATVPAAEIAAGEAPAAPAVHTEPQSPSLENPAAPLADISNILSPFSGTELVKNPTTGSWQTHNGTDIAAEVGSDVMAVSSGQVTAVNDDPLWGTTVVIDHHNGFVSKYCSLAKDLSVQKGDNVVSGDVIGVIAETADIESAVAPHLHIELTHNGSFVDPMSYISK